MKLYGVELSSFGFLRLSLISSSIVTIIISIIDPPLVSEMNTESFWSIFINAVLPVLSLILMIVLFFDYLMSKMRASDLQGKPKQVFIVIYKTELAVIFIMLLYWIPFFVTLGD